MTVTSPAGFIAAGVACGLKKSGNKDLALVQNLGPLYNSAVVFTSNRCKANPILWSQQVIADNRPGANGITALDHVAKSAPDGYTLLMANLGPNAINPAVYSKLPYDPVKDFATVTFTTLVPQVLVASPSLPAKSVRELVSPNELVVTMRTGAKQGIDALAKTLDVPKSAVTIVAGTTARLKRVEIAGDPASLAARLEGLSP